MNLLSIGKEIISNYFFMKSLTRNYGEPVNLSKKESQKILNDLRTDKMMEQKFALVLNVKTFQSDFELNVTKYIDCKKGYEADKFLYSMHPDFLEDYLKYARASYKFADENKHLLSPLAQCARSTIPLKLKDGRYYWVLQEAIPFELDAQNNMLTHLNIYTILRPMEDGEKVSVISRLYNNGFEVTEWAQMIWKDFFTSRSFELTPEQKRIVESLNNNIEQSNIEIAQSLSKQKNTIDIQNKQILARAREAFPNHTFVHIKDVVRFLREIDYFNNGNNKVE
jgi:hypothetical protein